MPNRHLLQTENIITQFELNTKTTTAYQDKSKRSENLLKTSLRQGLDSPFAHLSGLQDSASDQSMMSLGNDESSGGFTTNRQQSSL